MVEYLDPILSKINYVEKKVRIGLIIGLANFWNLLWEKRSALESTWIRVIVFSALIYKLLSRDFTSYGTMPEFLMQAYPADIFAIHRGYSVMGVWWLVDLVTGHWVHWILPIPSAKLLGIIQCLTVFLCGMVIFFGRGPKRIFAVGTYILLSYIFGYIWRSGGEVDAVFIQLTVALFYCFTQNKEFTVFQCSGRLLTKTREDGYFFSMTLLAFVFYYFTAGLNKLVDVSLLGWFQYELVDLAQMQAERMQLGFHKHVLVMDFLHGKQWLNYILPPLVYVFHLLAPTIYFKRDFIFTTVIFYFGFHIFSWSVGILFTGLMLSWLALLPVNKICQPLVINWNKTSLLATLVVKFLKVFDIFGRLSFESSNFENELISARQKGDELNKGPSLNQVLWTSPVWWPLLPILYFPILGWLIRSIAKYLFIKFKL